MAVVVAVVDAAASCAAVFARDLMGEWNVGRGLARRRAGDSPAVTARPLEPPPPAPPLPPVDGGLYGLRVSGEERMPSGTGSSCTGPSA